MTRAQFLRLAAGSSLCTLLGGCTLAGPSSAASTKTVRYYRYAENQAADYPTTQAASYFAELVRERTDGEIDIQVYPDAALGDEASVVEQMQRGMIDFSRVSLGTLSEFYAPLNVLQMPYLYSDADHMWRVLDGEIGDYFLQTMPNAALCGLSWYDAGARSFYSSTAPICTLEDMRGRVVRVQESTLMCDMVTALGATPVTSSFSQVYSGLQSGEMDTAENNFPSYDSMKHYRVAPYFSEDQHMRIPEMQIVSQRIWDEFSSAEKEILRTAARESAEYERTLWQLRETESRQHVQQAGTVINTLNAGEHDRFYAAVQPLYTQYCADQTDLVDAIRKA